MHKHSMKTEKRVSLRQSDREREIDIERERGKEGGREIEGEREGGTCGRRVTPLCFYRTAPSAAP